MSKMKKIITQMTNTMTKNYKNNDKNNKKYKDDKK